MSDNDLIRRGDALYAIAGWEIPSTAISALPAVQPTVKPLRYIEPEGETLEQMRDHARQHPLAQAGDMRLVWVNEGDLHMHRHEVLIGIGKDHHCYITFTDSDDVEALKEERHG